MNRLGLFGEPDSVSPMLPSIDAPMNHAPLYSIDYAAGSRLSAQVRARNKEIAAEYDAALEKISGALRAWQIALHRSTQFLEAFEEIR